LRDTADELVGAYVGGFGNPHPKLMVIGEAPGPDEARAGRPFVGTTGKMLAEATEDAGLRFDDTYRTNVFKYFPPGSDIRRAAETGHTIEECLPQLQAEIEALKPNCILAVGDQSLFHTTGKQGIFTWRGSILSTPHGVKVIPTIHPAALFKQTAKGKGAIPWRTWYTIKHDIWRAVKDSEFPDLRLPLRNYRVCRGPADLTGFLRSYESVKVWSVDIEGSCPPVCIALAPNSKDAMSIPLFNAGSWKEPGKGLRYSEYVEIWKILDRFFADESIKFIGQNFKYDHEKLLRPLGFKIGKNRLHADVGLMAHVVQPEFQIALEFLASIYTREPFWKAEGDDFDYSRHPLERLLKYNCTDAMVTYECCERLLEDLRELGLESYYFEYKNKLHDLYMDIERVGFKIDEDVRVELIKKYVEMYNEANQKIKEASGYFINTGSNAKTGDVHWLLFQVMKFPQRESVDDSTIGLLLANHAKTQQQKDVLFNVIVARQCRKTINTYLTATPDFDGRMRGAWRIPGTETDRTASKMLEPPVRPRGIIGKGSRAKKKKIGIMTHNLTKHGDVGADIRKMYVPDDGYWFGECDASQVEARIVALLAEDYELLKLFETVDIHRLTASWLFGIPPEKIAKDSIPRQIGKVVRHASSYGMGKRTLADLLAYWSQKLGKDLTQSEWRCQQHIDTFHRNTPRIRGVYHEEIQRLARVNNRTLVDPFGCPRTFMARWGDELFREMYAHIPQKVGSSNLAKRAMLRIKERIPDLLINNEAHDGITWQSKPENFDRDARIIKEEFERPIDFSRCSLPRGSIVIPAEVKIAKNNYKEFVDYKFEPVAA
jgi:uracil-DNA glycosylase